VCGDSIAAAYDVVEKAAHVANAGHTVDEERRHNELVGDRGGARVEVDMRMHVPESGDQILSTSINYLRIMRYPNTPGFGNGFDSIRGDKYSHARARRHSCHVDHCDVGNGK
jgi:hypothetical protein